MKRKGVISFILFVFFFSSFCFWGENGIGHTLGIKLLLVCTCSTLLASIQHICSVYFVTIELATIMIFSLSATLCVFTILGDVGYSLSFLSLALV